MYPVFCKAVELSILTTSILEAEAALAESCAPNRKMLKNNKAAQKMDASPCVLNDFLINDYLPIIPLAPKLVSL